jgi:hypothetical protein
MIVHRRGAEFAESIIYISAERAEIYKLPFDGLFVFRPLNGKQNLLNLCKLCVFAVK